MHRTVCLKRVPVLVFHSVRTSLEGQLGELQDLTMPASAFRAVLRRLRRARFESITCDQLVAHLRDGAALPERPILLTFDDGYLDNRTVAAPLLEAHGFRAAVFVASDYVEDGQELRPTLADDERAPQRGYLNRGELRALSAGTTLEIQAHTASHARPACGPRVVDVVRPGNDGRWRRLTEDREYRGREHAAPADLPLGTPLFEDAWIGEARRFEPDPALDQQLTALVEQRGGASFFERPGWRATLASALPPEQARGLQAEPAEAARELADDLVRCRADLESWTGRSVDHLAWPGGGASRPGVDLALDDVGFRSTFGTSRRCAGVEPSPRAIPRTYFGQHYRGPLYDTLVSAKASGIARLEAGQGGRAAIAFANRGMRALARPAPEASAPLEPAPTP